MLLETAYGIGHLLELIRVLDVRRTAVGGVEALQVEVPTPLAGRLAIALDLSPLAFIAGKVLVIDWRRAIQYQREK